MVNSIQRGLDTLLCHLISPSHNSVSPELQRVALQQFIKNPHNPALTTMQSLRDYAQRNTQQVGFNNLLHHRVSLCSLILTPQFYKLIQDEHMSFDEIYGHLKGLSKMDLCRVYRCMQHPWFSWLVPNSLSFKNLIKLTDEQIAFLQSESVVRLLSVDSNQESIYLCSHLPRNAFLVTADKALEWKNDIDICYLLALGKIEPCEVERVRAIFQEYAEDYKKANAYLGRKRCLTLLYEGKVTVDQLEKVHNSLMYHEIYDALHSQVLPTDTIISRVDELVSSADNVLALFPGDTYPWGAIFFMSNAEFERHVAKYDSLYTESQIFKALYSSSKKIYLLGEEKIFSLLETLRNPEVLRGLTKQLPVLKILSSERVSALIQEGNFNFKGVWNAVKNFNALKIETFLKNLENPWICSLVPTRISYETLGMLDEKEVKRLSSPSAIKLFSHANTYKYARVREWMDDATVADLVLKGMSLENANQLKKALKPLEKRMSASEYLKFSTRFAYLLEARKASILDINTAWGPPLTEDDLFSALMENRVTLETLRNRLPTVMGLSKQIQLDFHRPLQQI